MLEGIVVIEFGRIFSAPLCGRILSDLGAKVIKVERKGTGDESRNYGNKLPNGLSDYFFALNRGKEWVSLDLKEEADYGTALDWIKGADVLIHNTLQDSFDRLGFSYETTKAVNPRLVYTAISGYGGNGKYKNTPSQDAVIQGLSGFMSLTGLPDGLPLKTGIPVVDYVTGQYAAIGALSALWERERTGRGKLVRISLLESAMNMISIEAARYLNTGVVTTRHGNRHASIAPYNSFRTRDGYVLVAIANDAMFMRFSKVLGLDPNGYETNEERLSRIEPLEDAIQMKTKAFSTEELIRLLRDNKISVGPIRDLPQAFQSDEVKGLNIVGEMDGCRYVKDPMTFIDEGDPIH